jgi:hypothetical protein
MKMLLDLEGAAEAEGGIKRVRKEIDKTADATDGLTVATGRNEQQMTNTFLALQALTSGLNQLTGGAMKAIGGLSATGAVSDELALSLQNNVRQFELLTGTMEIGIAAVNIYTGAMELYTTSAFAATYATLGLNAALAANPMVMIGLVLMGVVITLIALGARFKHVADTVHGLSAAFRELLELMGSVKDVFGDIGGAAGNFADNITDRFSIGANFGGGGMA